MFVAATTPPSQTPKPTPPAQPAPKPAPADPTTTTVQLQWDASFFGRDHGAGMKFAPGKDGAEAMTTLWTTVSMGRDGRIENVAKGDAYQQAIAKVMSDAFTRNDAELAKLTSNFALDAAYKPGNGHFDLRIDRPGTDRDLRYVGLMTAMPAPIRDMLVAAQGLHRYI